MHFILCPHRRRIAKFYKILQTSFSYFAKKGPKGTRGMVPTIPFLPRIDKISKLQHPKMG
jgi:hypothetical protein